MQFLSGHDNASKILKFLFNYITFRNYKKLRNLHFAMDKLYILLQQLQ